MNLDRELRPTTFEDYISSNNEGIVEDVKGFLETGDPPHFIFVGPPGCGKNTLYWIFASLFLGREISIDTEEGDREYTEINASKEGGIDTVRTDITDFSSFVIRNHRKCCLIDEFDGSSKQMQMALKHVIEANEDKCHFCFIMNDDSAVIDAIFSRCYIAYFKRPKKQDITQWFIEKSYLKGVQFEDLSLVSDIVDYYGGDFRRMLTDCLESLRGRAFDGRKINKEDLWKIYEGDTRGVAQKVFDSESPIDTWAKYWKEDNFDNRRFLVDYMKLFYGKNAPLFAKIDSRLRRGCNPMVQMSALFSVLKHG